MSNIKALDMTKVNANAVKMAETLLEECKKGTVISFAVVKECTDSRYDIVITANDSTRRLAGALLECAIHALGFQSEQ